MFHTYPDDQIPLDPPKGSEWMKRGDSIGMRIVYGLETARDIEWRGPCARHHLKYRSNTFYSKFYYKHRHQINQIESQASK